ncbi:MAG: hypothetical protein JWM37_301 [Candidatus Saccharibacteria bacterium]|nr:hypothetical protein [Candidatus Saccharibacteria bacterium]
MKRKWDISNDATRRHCANEILARLEEQDGGEFGLLAAEEIMDIVVRNLGPDIYGLAIADAQQLTHDKLSDLDVELDLMKSNS